MCPECSDDIQSIELSVNSPSAEIRYTLDGSTPADSSTLYYSSIPVESTTVLRALAFDAGLFQSSILTHTYFINQTSTLPVISLSTAPANFFDDEIGIYGLYDKDGKGIINFNFLEDWERPIHMEFYEPDGSLAFNVDAGIKIYGLLTKFKPQKPFRIFLRREYGDTKIKHQIFPDLPITEFNRLDLRNGGDDIPSTHFQDGMIHSLVKDKNVDIQAFRPCVVYINGDYWGIYNIRERLDEDYIASHHGIDPDNIDFLRFLHARIGLEVVRGDSIHYAAMIDYMENNDLSVPANYEYVETQIDVNNFIDYNITEIYSANFNYLIDNNRFWRPGTPEGKWRWMLSDLDGGFPFSGEIVEGIKQDYTFNVFGFLTGDIVDTYKMRYVRAFILRKLLENSSFKHNFINRFADYLNTIFSPDTVIQKINEIKELLEPEMLAHIRKWEGYPAIGPYIGTSRSDWYNNVDGTIEFAENRPEYVRSHIIEHFNLSGTAQVDLDISQSGGGKIKINSLVIEDYPWNSIYFKDVPIQVTALPDLGYRFIGWTGVTPEDSPSLDITLTDDVSVAVVFEKIGDDIVLDRYHSPYEIRTDQIISAGKTLTVGPGVELIMSENANIYVENELHLNGTSDQPITIRPADNSQSWGAICLDNAAGASTLSNVIIRGAATGRDWDNFSAAVSVLNSDITLDNVQFEDNKQSIFARGGSVTVRNCLFTETNSNEHINITEADALVENCTFQNIIMGDAIDFDGITNGIIRNNKILGTVDSDGDGIDIGDDCSGILITNNVIFDCADKGISVGEGAKDIKIERNVIVGCLYGIAVKDSANAFIDHNTLYNNDIAVAAYEKGVERFGGGTAVITNSILSKSGISALFTDELSSITVSYTISDTELLPGEGNIQADPKFVSPLYRDFNLLSISPAIDAGDPQSTLDPDETRSDMGMKFSQEADVNIVINEINYNSSGDFNPDDWLELYNPNDEEIDLSGWMLKDEDDTHVFVLPINSVISAREYFVLCRDAVVFHGMF
ncbi:MAG: hypothetical protein HOC71_09145, partial [Candidatus Latescibacteria bacterium]|nr:hypothetical protein [Candidatus Latescibacterota bacterium]